MLRKRKSKRQARQISFKSRKNRRRQLITLGRIGKYGVHSFVRNSWLSVAATLIMSITLLIILFAIALSTVLASTVKQMRDDIDMSIYVVNTIDKKSIQKFKSELESLETVEQVRYASAADNQTQVARDSGGDPGVIDAITEAKNVLPSTFHVQVKDINDTSELEKFVNGSDIYAKFRHRTPPSYASGRRDAIDNIARVTRFVERAGLMAATIFTTIALLVVFNTIRMAIFNRRDEIYMMRLIGADPSFIRGPFVVEAMMNGIIAGAVATGGLSLVFNLSKDKLLNYGVAIDPAINFLHYRWPLVLLFSIGIGIVIGVVSSLLATHQYIKKDF